jgi:hypothetical protein
MEADNACLYAVFFTIVGTQPLGNEFFPAVRILWLSGIGILFSKGRHVSRCLLVLRINARGGGVQIALGAVNPRRFYRMQVY